MKSVLVTTLLSDAARVLQDPTFVRWTRVHHQRNLNEGYRALFIMRPDVGMTTGTFTCAAGYRQILTKTPGGFPTAQRLRSVVRNVATGSTKQAVQLVPQAALDTQRPGWTDEAQALSIQLYCYDLLLPQQFLVYPPALATAQLEVVYDALPTQHALTEEQLTTDTTTAISVDDIYSGPLLDFMLYRAFTTDAEYAANAERAQQHLNAFTQTVGVDMQSDMSTGPTNTPRGG